MRREKFEFSVSPPVVVYRHVNGQRHEPLEEVVCEVEDEQTGGVIEALSLRRGSLLEMLPLQVIRTTYLPPRLRSPASPAQTLNPASPALPAVLQVALACQSCTEP